MSVPPKHTVIVVPGKEGKPGGSEMIQVYISNLMSLASNLPTHLANQIRQEFSYFVPGYERTAEYQFGRWDGKKYLLFSDGPDRWKFPTGLLHRLLTWLYSRQIPYQVVQDLSGTTPEPKMNYLKSAGFQMFPYQVEAAVTAVTKSVGRMGGILRMATGSGKSPVSSKIIQIQRVPTVVFVNTKDLLHQWHDELTRSLKCPIGKVGDGHCDVHDITIATIQTTCRVFGIVTPKHGRERAITADTTLYKQHIRRTQLVVCDEVHHVAADTNYECVFLCTNLLSVVGLSASPWRDDGLDILIEAASGPVIYTKTASELIDEINPLTGRPYLVAPRIIAYSIPEPPVLTPAHVDTSLPHEFYKAWVVDHDARNRFIARLAMQDMTEGRIVLVLVKRLEHGEILERLIPGSRFVEGKCTGKARKTAYEAARAGTLKCLIATTLADQGLDLPVVSSLILAGGGRSSTRALQRIGRVLRDYPGKMDARVHDIIDAHGNFKGHYAARQRIYRTEPRFTITRVQVTREEMAL